MTKDGRCRICGGEADSGKIGFCKKHYDDHSKRCRNRYREKMGISLDAPVVKYDWENVDWRLSVKEIASDLGCHTSHIYRQLKKKRLASEPTSL